jgi:hypothetical protein
MQRLLRARRSSCRSRIRSQASTWSCLRTGAWTRRRRPRRSRTATAAPSRGPTRPCCAASRRACLPRKRGRSRTSPRCASSRRTARCVRPPSSRSLLGRSTASTSARSRLTERTPPRDRAPACTCTSSTPVSAPRTASSPAGSAQGSTRWTTDRGRTTATAMGRRWRASRRARCTASPGARCSTRSASSTAAAPARSRPS